MSYAKAVKNLKVKKEMIEALPVDKRDRDQGIEFSYKGELYFIRCYRDDAYFGKGYAVNNMSNIMDSMNVEKITGTSLHLFTYDMMGRKHKYRMSLAEMNF